MTGNKLIKYLEDWAPPGAGWERDNTGFQLGSGGEKIRNVFLCLELNEKALAEAIKKNCNFIFTHHPLIYKPISRIDTENNQTAKIIQKTIKHDITVYSAHTNLDFAKEGVSFELSKVVGLKNVEFLVTESKNQYKLVVFVPSDKLELVSNAIFKAGGGVIGEYSNCSYRLSGEGTFKGSSASKPAVGTKERFEIINEIRLEVLVDSWNLKKVIDRMIQSHPYEEPAYDIYQLNNNNPNFGEGVIGDLEKSLTANEFLKYISKKLNLTSLRFNKGKASKIKRVAVCGGSGSNNFKNAIRLGADAFVTADIKYHTFQDAENKIMLIDAGHYETEIFVLNSVKRKMEEYIKSENWKIKVFKYSGSTNPVRIYNL